MSEATKQSTAPSAASTGPAEQYLFPLYGGEPWSAIVGTLSPAQAADADLMATVHQQLETAAAGYLTQTRQHRGRFAKGSQARRLLQARDDIQAALTLAEEMGNAPWKDALGEALKAIYETTQVGAFDMLRLSHNKNTNPERDLLRHRVLMVWTDTLAGQLTTGRRSDAAPGKREADSPAIRFLMAAVEPLDPIGREAAKKIVEAEKRGRARAQKLIAERRKQLAKKAAE